MKIVHQITPPTTYCSLRQAEVYLLNNTLVNLVLVFCSGSSLVC